MKRYYIRVHRKENKGFCSIEFDAGDDEHAKNLIQSFFDLLEADNNYELADITIPYDKKKLVEF